MIRYENRCCSCAAPAYPCLGNYCPNRNVKVCSCDCCGREVETLYIYDGQEVCEDCLIDYVNNDNDYECEECHKETDELIKHDDAWICRECLLKYYKAED